MEIIWLGHSCFLIRWGDKALVTDPPDESVGYRLPPLQADMVLISHDHDDHSNIGAIQGSPVVVRAVGEHLASGVRFRGVATWHDQHHGAMRGPNTAFCFELEGVRLCHLGDLGHLLTPDQLAEIGPVDLLFLPVGGIYTLDAKAAAAVADQLKPAVVVPMHYLTGQLSFELEPVGSFLKGRKVEGPLPSLNVTRDSLGPPRTVILECRSSL
ncbi:MAG: metal-dependent hydrolase [Methanosaeta sp. PtaB.Bin039]|nr:MAG: metal-dependent hydrolase [Methanosaeta sp. PtaB.Bin039]OPY44613.1 MAG: metal-dependent hydrolase [Methanosaeta sp. PtaU1.Bin028]HOT06398.1 MBL fold metallo-hydrolase [Methanotrichaceae archaeon]HQF16169.1 MBL fold metallo-hydrolase [Methanotrichaceae archaeon]HQI90905.1 MBL fold metallo-hydrolase [Methanotrichaceae archaeon]